MDLECKTKNLTDFLTQAPQNDIRIPNQNEPPSWEVDPNTSLILSKYDIDTGIIEILQAGSCRTRFTSFVNSLHIATTNIDANCFTADPGVKIIAENESLNSP